MIGIDDITVLNDLTARLAEVTDLQLDIVQKQLEPPGARDKVVGVIASPTRALWVLSRLFHAEHMMCQARAMELAAPELIEEHLRNAMIASEFEDLVDELMWTQARTDTGYWGKDNVGIRSGWQLVAFESKQNPLIELLKLGPLPLRPPE